RLVVERQRVSEIPVTPTGNTILPDRTVWDLALWVDLARVAGLRGRLPAETLRPGFEVANLGDELVRDAQFFPQPGRSWLVRLEGTWCGARHASPPGCWPARSRPHRSPCARRSSSTRPIPVAWRCPAPSRPGSTGSIRRRASRW